MSNNQEIEFFWFQCEGLSDYDENSWRWYLHNKKGGERNHAYVFDAIKTGSQVLCYHLRNGIIGRFVVKIKPLIVAISSLRRKWIFN